MSRRSGPIVALLLCGGLAACGGGGGGGTTTVTPPASPPPAASFRTLSAPSGFAMETGSVRSKAVTADALLAGGPMPAGYDSPQVHTWVNFFYTDGDGVARTLAIVRWSVLASLGTQGMRLELPSAAGSLQYDVYNANGSRSGSLSR